MARYTYAESLVELADAVGLPASTVQRYHAERAGNGFPSATKGGRYNIEKTRAWIEEYEAKKASRALDRRKGKLRGDGLDPESEDGLLEGIRPEDLEGGREVELDDRIYLNNEGELKNYMTRRVLQTRLAKERGTLLDRSEVERAQRAQGRLVRHRLLEAVKPIARRVTGKSTRDVEQILGEELANVLRDLAKEAAALGVAS